MVITGRGKLNRIVWAGLASNTYSEGVPAFAHEDGDDQAGNRDILPNVGRCIGRINQGFVGRKEAPG
jgi:hypothetical protein